MILRYGSYSHEESECTVVLSKEVVENEAGQPYEERQTWTVTGRLQADTPGLLLAKMVALQAAYSVWYRDFGLYDGNTLMLALVNRGSTSGVKIVRPPSYPQGEGAQLTTFLDYTIVAAATYPAGNGQNPLKAFTETLAFSGGGPRRAVVECVNAPPQEQVLTAFTAYRATQQGSAVGLYGYPPVPPPLFPGKLEEAGRPVFGSPKLRNGAYTDFPVSWSYTFASATPLVGLPNRWPAG